MAQAASLLLTLGLNLRHEHDLDRDYLARMQEGFTLPTEVTDRCRYEVVRVPTIRAALSWTFTCAPVAGAAPGVPCCTFGRSSL